MAKTYPIFIVRFIYGFGLISLVAFFTLAKPDNASGQVLRALANNTFSGAINGALLGGATMALTNNEDFGPVRIGAGLGTLSGMGIGIYDISQDPGYVEGTFHTASISGYIILVDTFYGIVTGTVAGIAIALLGNNRLDIGAQYGAGAGAWVGFSFGLIDAFYLSYHTSRTDYFSSHQYQGTGIIQVEMSSNYQIGFLNPNIYAFPEMTTQSMTIRQHFGMELAHVSFRF